MTNITRIMNGSIKYAIDTINKVDRLEAIPEKLLLGNKITESRLAAYSLLHEILVKSGYGSLDELEKDDLGCPQTASSRRLWVSVAHSNILVAAAASVIGKVGIDVERVTEWSGGMENMAFTEKEKSYLNTVLERASSATELWVKKEALGKALGVGIEDYVLATSVLQQPVFINGGTFFLKEIKTLDSHRAAICFLDKD